MANRCIHKPIYGFNNIEHTVASRTKYNTLSRRKQYTTSQTLIYILSYLSQNNSKKHSQFFQNIKPDVIKSENFGDDLTIIIAK